MYLIAWLLYSNAPLIYTSFALSFNLIWLASVWQCLVAQILVPSLPEMCLLLKACRLRLVNGKMSRIDGKNSYSALLCAGMLQRWLQQQLEVPLVPRCITRALSDPSTGPARVGPTKTPPPWSEIYPLNITRYSSCNIALPDSKHLYLT